MGDLTCEWCGGSFPRRSNMGPIPRYCSSGHRQRAHEVRRIQRLETEITRLRSAMEAMADQVTAEAFHPNAILTGDGSPLVHSAYVLQLISEATADPACAPGRP